MVGRLELGDLEVPAQPDTFSDQLKMTKFSQIFLLAWQLCSMINCMCFLKNSF